MSALWLGLKRGLSAVGLTLMLAEGAVAAGLMTPADGSLPALEIKQHHVNVMVEDGYAITTIDQQFYNPNNMALEAVYSFPLPEKASVAEFTYWIDGKPVVGEVLEKAKADTIYQQEKSNGRRAAITEQDRYHSFDSRVYPVLPQQEVKLRLVYLQPVHIDTSIGRYVYPLEEGGVDEQKLSFWRYNEAVTEAFSFNLTMRSSYPIDDFRLPQHPQATITQGSAKQWQVSFNNGAAANNDEESVTVSSASSVQTLDKDIVVYWRHQQGLPGSVDMISYKSANSDRGTFMLSVTPGDDLANIQSGRDWVFVLDISGSMKGKYQSLVEGVKKGLAKLSSNDRYKIVLFNNTAHELTQGYTAVSADNISRSIERLENNSPGGGTNLYEGLEKGIKGLDADRASAILLVTDGVANVGMKEKKDFLALLEQYDVRLFSFVMGNSANRPLLEGMAKVSNGFAVNISNSDDIVGQLVLTASKLNHEAYRDIELDIKGVKVKDLTPAKLSSLYRGQQLIVFGHYWGDGVAELEIKGKVGGGDKVYRSALQFPALNERNPELERLWAYASIEDLQNHIDYLGSDDDSEQAIIDLAVEYGLVTNYTSMLVVEEAVFNEYNIARDNAARVAVEHGAQQQRKAAPVKNHRQDSQQPAFNTPKAYPSNNSGGGALGPWFLLILLPLLLAIKNKQR
jgi:Ca-activated chloride channel family protein